MPKFLVKYPFRGAIRGIHVRDYVLGERVEIDDPDLSRVALEQNWIEPCDEASDSADSTDGTDEKAAVKAPRNKAVKSAPKAKGEAAE